ncbi:TOM1-like protein 2 isoform X2 [Cimex lectularius]|uniref:TOM1-like protein 2 n=1 Tax=Cimex lectularius TaxID=79782 RepID=A0A8I6RGD0_CIMLE|nr:TOM1-like protein 2 isoform X2 [Cimex lectularius]
MASFFAVGGNPFSTPVGQKIEQATDPSLASENWSLNMEICDLINDTEDGPKDAIKAIRKRLQTSVGKNYTTVMFTLTVLETCVKNCGRRFHVLVCNKEFVGELVKLIGPKNGPPMAVQEKVLSLIQAWVDAFHQQQDLNGVVQVYQELKAKGIEFPMTDLDSMAPIHTPKKSVKTETVVSESPSKGPGSSMGEITSPLSQEQLTKLREDVDILQTNMTIFGDMLSEMSPGNEHPSDIELFHELHLTLVEMQKRLVELISKLTFDEITEDLLRINDHLINLFLRYSRYEKNREVAKDGANNSGPSNDDSLIDLGNEAAGGVANPAHLTKQMEGLSIGNRLPNTNNDHKVKAKVNDVDDTDFDMFAQSRKVSYESSKTSGSSYESNTKNIVSNNLSQASEARAQGTTMHKESDFDEMAAWLAQGGNDQISGQESLTSSEFDRFLAERAAAAEGIPSVDHNQSTNHQQKRMEN